jgi:hypothetical protein
MWLTLFVAVVFFVVAALKANKQGADAAQFPILFGIMALVSFFLRMYYRRSK